MGDALASSRARWAAGAAAALAYAAVSHALMTRAQDSPWSLAIILGPAVVLGAAWAWSAGRRWLAAAGVLVVVLLMLQGAIGKGIPARWLYLAQHAGVHLALAIGFGSTLRRGAEPLISALARRVHGSLSPAMERYTRQVTLAWTLYFVAMATASWCCSPPASSRAGRCWPTSSPPCSPPASSWANTWCATGCIPTSNA
ncbi:hypothetical protein [Ramlibacter montanisoli]|uniref:Uncharacterized protein n=1 Tax=Ramlibacter montanisoli TaxID=2732512 RepID=A0A849K2U5_9BURK|nr:hypothetical protein [Ramlibacter montanisoli]NNU42808.1 hypothetical protein [Ramlibacter montanisoli]